MIRARAHNNMSLELITLHQLRLDHLRIRPLAVRSNPWSLSLSASIVGSRLLSSSPRSSRVDVLQSKTVLPF
jgi:hypothetical protein